MQPLLTNTLLKDRFVWVAPECAAPRSGREFTRHRGARQLQSAGDFVVFVFTSTALSEWAIPMAIEATASQTVQSMESFEYRAEVARGYANLLQFRIEPDQPTDLDTAPHPTYRFPD